MNKLSVILASGSASRRSLLANAGVEATGIKPNVDEDAAKAAFRAEGMRVADQALRLAELKAIKVSRNHSGLVIGGDQMLNLDGEPLDKPADMAEAARHLRRFSGKVHRLETAIVIAENGEPVWRHLTSPKLTVRPLDDTFIDHYLKAAGPDILNTVGAYQLEGVGAQLFSRIEGDYFSILGLPLLPLLDYLRVRGVIAA
ncbi:septum formation protein Maf [Henriciella mobilis]|uniref:Maf family protein n=1 Tax=Henriciella mobilis TaxID=2305467 RepID=UPI000E66D1AE|nr:Maf family protein [Henriciella mobilis]RIJ17894.1 septum formation protein Maf [Henriciella mobilis]RIJ25294.1 septum formation protein Maf [Henriciella mobilis]